MQQNELAIGSAFLRRKEAADYIGVSKSHLDRLALEGNGPPYSKLSPKLCLYQIKDLDDWVSSHRVTSTSQTISH